MPKPLIALDWGTTRARAFLISGTGEVLERRIADRGIQSVPAGGYPEAFAELAGDFRETAPDAAIVLAGMVGSRNGWIEARYVPCPASPAEIAANAIKAAIDAATTATILPGLSCDDGAFDVMRGEETLIVGLGLSDGIACLPGTHSKWAEIRQGRITRFASFMTGEIYGLLRNDFIRPARRSPFGRGRRGWRHAWPRCGRPTRRPAQHRFRRPHRGSRRPDAGRRSRALSLGAAGRAGDRGGGGPVRQGPDYPSRCGRRPGQSYGAGLQARGHAIQLISPEAAFVAGVRRLAADLPA